MSGSLKDVLEAMQALAVIPVAVGVLRSELLRLRQERDEPFRRSPPRFAARLKHVTSSPSVHVSERWTIPIT